MALVMSCQCNTDFLSAKLVIAILQQVPSVMAYASWSLKPAEKNYSIIEKRVFSSSLCY